MSDYTPDHWSIIKIEREETKQEQLAREEQETKNKQYRQKMYEDLKKEFEGKK